MQVLALNGSPRVEESNSQRMLAPLLAGLAAAGAGVTQHYLAKLDVHYCTGCYGCWTRTPGQCATWRDGMDMLLPQLQAADLLVLAFPLYVYSMPARVKAFLERLLPSEEPWMVPHPQRPVTAHPSRGPRRFKLAVLCSAGLPEREHFSSLKLTLEQIAGMLSVEIALLHFRPAAGVLEVEQLQPLLAPYYAALRQTGVALARGERVPEAAQAALDMDFLPAGPQFYNAQANSYWRYQLAKHGHDATPPENAPLPPGAPLPAAG
jgi:multimeric flavodoxin WrbA